MQKAPALDGVLEVALYVDDLSRSVQFYTGLFGFSIIYASDRLQALGDAPHRQVLLLFKKGASANLPISAHDGDGQQHLAWAIPASDFERWQERLAALGITVEELKEWDRGGKSLYFRDPDGHLLELATPGVWTIYSKRT